MTWSDIESELTAAKNGNMTPLLKVLKSGVVTGPTTSDAVTDADTGGDQRWYDVLASYQDGDLSEDQFDQCLAAVRAVAPETSDGV